MDIKKSRLSAVENFKCMVLFKGILVVCGNWLQIAKTFAQQYSPASGSSF
jgi:hypothetical protein